MRYEMFVFLFFVKFLECNGRAFMEFMEPSQNIRDAFISIFAIEFFIELVYMEKDFLGEDEDATRIPKTMYVKQSACPYVWCVFVMSVSTNFVKRIIYALFCSAHSHF